MSISRLLLSITLLFSSISSSEAFVEDIHSGIPSIRIPSKLKTVRKINNRIKNQRRRLRRRGRKLKGIEFNFNSLNNLRGIRLPASLERLSLTNIDLNTFEGIELPKGLKYLSVFNLKDGTGDFSSLSLNENLEELYISLHVDTPLIPETIKDIPPNLETVIYGPGLSNLDQMIVADSIKNIWLDVGIDNNDDWSLLPNGLDCLTIEGEVGDFRNLENIQLPNDLKCFELGLFQGLFVGGATDYDELSLPSSLEFFAFEAGFSNSIQFTGVNLPSNLRTLEINTSRSNLSYLSNIQFPEGLKVLFLNNQSETENFDVGTAILAMDFPDTLERLDLRSKVIGDITNLDLPPNLIELNLQFSSIDNLDGLKNADYPETLQKIYLHQNRLNAKESKEIVSFFQENFPNIEIEFNIALESNRLVPFVLFDENKSRAF